MKDLPFLGISSYPDNREEFQKKLDGVSKEKNMNGDEIRLILDKKLNDAGFLTVWERNYIGQNISPFDLAAGDESTLAVHGFEIKGDRDDYSRISRQIPHYLFVCSSVYIVVHKKKELPYLPFGVGWIRIFEDESVYIEHHGFPQDPFNIGTNSDWEAIFKANGLGKSHKRAERVLHLLQDIRKNLLFNRYFAVHKGWGTKQYDKWWPLTEEQKALVIGFDVPWHLKDLSKDLKLMEKRFDRIKAAIEIGQGSDQKKLK